MFSFIVSLHFTWNMEGKQFKETIPIFIQTNPEDLFVQRKNLYGVRCFPYLIKYIRDWKTQSKQSIDLCICSDGEKKWRPASMYIPETSLRQRFPSRVELPNEKWNRRKSVVFARCRGRSFLYITSLIKGYWPSSSMPTFNLRFLFFFYVILGHFLTFRLLLLPEHSICWFSKSNWIGFYFPCMDYIFNGK